jgi:5-(carboxyamino)imidazole ribonucleotide mutase
MVDIQIFLGSNSDNEIGKKVTSVLDEQKDYNYKVDIISAHRNPEELRKAVRKSEAKIFICIAGLSAALPGVVASLTRKPVIGVPVAAALGGIDALLSIVQMPKGIPVACVGVNNGQNAAYLALRILNS